MILALTDRDLVDIGGSEIRMISERIQGIEWDLFGVRGEFKDLGLVSYGGNYYYATLYTPIPLFDEVE